MTRRLIEEAFPLKKVSEDSKHEKNVRHGHISTLHIWPARRPLAACRAAIIAALLPDPGDEKKREDYLRRISNITRWKSENGPDLQFFRDEIRKAFGGRAPKVLDMFAGGGAIPLEAMRLGCDVTAIDYNPVAWFILKCALEFPQKLAGKKWPLPTDEGRHRSSAVGGKPLDIQSQMDLGVHEGDLAAQVRYWGQWVLARAREELAPYYPTIDGQTTVAYLWARTVPCQDPKCGATVPLLKTLWLSRKLRKDKKTYALRLMPNLSTRQINYEIFSPQSEDEVQSGTMEGGVNSSNVKCPCCGSYMRLDYIQSHGQSGSIGASLLTVVVGGQFGKDYRLPNENEQGILNSVESHLARAVGNLPFGLPTEQLDPTRPSKNAVGVSIVPRYGLDRFDKLFAKRQLLAIVTFANLIREVKDEISVQGYPNELADAIITDPPYYDAIPYADISDFFYVWLRRTLEKFGYSS